MQDITCNVLINNENKNVVSDVKCYLLSLSFILRISISLSSFRN